MRVGSPMSRVTWTPGDLAEAAVQLRRIIDALPPTTARDRATARRIEGTAVALAAVAAHSRPWSTDGEVTHPCGDITLNECTTGK